MERIDALKGHFESSPALTKALHLLNQGDIDGLQNLISENPNFSQEYSQFLEAAGSEDLPTLDELLRLCNLNGVEFGVAVKNVQAKLSAFIHNLMGEMV